MAVVFPVDSFSTAKKLIVKALYSSKKHRVVLKKHRDVLMKTTRRFGETTRRFARDVTACSVKVDIEVRKLKK